MISTAHKDKYGNIRWYNDGSLHRENGPAIECADEYKAWYIDGYLHRENGPAIEYPDGTKKWFINGSLHRENGPAVEGVNGKKEWWFNGLLHRENGPAIEHVDGDIEYYLNNQTGPKIEQQVKENMARIQAEKDQQELSTELLRDDEISAKINISSAKVIKKL